MLTVKTTATTIHMNCITILPPMVLMKMPANGIQTCRSLIDLLLLHSLWMSPDIDIRPCYSN